MEQIEEGEAAVGVFFRDRDDEAKVRLHHFALGFLALVHPALEHPDVFFELFEIAACGKLPLVELSLRGCKFACSEFVFLRAGG